MRTIEWIDGYVDVIDQTALPQQRRVALHAVSDVVDAIHRLVVRGAPALGALGALGVALAAARSAELGYDPDAVRTGAPELGGAPGAPRGAAGTRRGPRCRAGAGGG
jgi:methylthioribose-1-phosphate isomerase